MQITETDIDIAHTIGSIEQIDLILRGNSVDAQRREQLRRERNRLQVSLVQLEAKATK